MTFNPTLKLKVSNVNNAMLVMMLWEMLEDPDSVRRGFSNLCSSGNYKWLLDEIEAFKDCIDEWDKHEHQKTTTKIDF